MTKHRAITLRTREQVGVAGDVNTGISEKLRHFYQSVQEEGIPDRFLSLLDRLDDVESKASDAPPVRRASRNDR